VDAGLTSIFAAISDEIMASAWPVAATRMLIPIVANCAPLFA
jgi:hypothetical protein